jgi:uncharacterized membrane protein
MLGLEVVALGLYALLLFLRFKTGARIYNLIGIAILVYLAFQFIESIPMVIAFVGLILYSLYDTFIGGN